MQITDYEISQEAFSPDQTQQVARVSLTMADRFVTLFCAVDMEGVDSPSARLDAFLREALRQLRRMPEFRTGGKTVELAANLSPDPALV